MKNEKFDVNNALVVLEMFVKTMERFIIDTENENRRFAKKLDLITQKLKELVKKYQSRRDFLKKVLKSPKIGGVR